MATGLDPKDTQYKEIIRRQIRHALTNKSSTNNYVDSITESFPPITDLLKHFVINFRSCGGKYIPCTRENFSDRLVQLIKGQKYKSILNTYPSFNKVLTAYNIPYENSINDNDPVDMVLAYSEMLVARSGSIVFSQNMSVYPSIRNLARDVVVVSFTSNIVDEMKSVFAPQQTNKDSYTFTEIITPSIPKIIDNKEFFTPLSPRFILLLID